MESCGAALVVSPMGGLVVSPLFGKNMFFAVVCWSHSLCLLLTLSCPVLVSASRTLSLPLRPSATTLDMFLICFAIYNQIHQIISDRPALILLMKLFDFESARFVPCQ